ncbi:hypothetical protein KUCAC02_016502, partial [Chaenocephalus aceratus]
TLRRQRLAELKPAGCVWPPGLITRLVSQPDPAVLHVPVSGPPPPQPELLLWKVIDVFIFNRESKRPHDRRAAHFCGLLKDRTSPNRKTASVLQEDVFTLLPEKGDLGTGTDHCPHFVRT